MPWIRRSLSPPQLLVVSFAGLISVGTLLLMAPAAAADRVSIGPVDAFFTATSAVCVTGLIVRDTPSAFSPFGHAVLLVLIQLGGLGYMTISTVLAGVVGRSITLHERLTLQEALHYEGFEGLVQFAGTVLKLTLAFELAGMVVLAVRWWGELGPQDALWFSAFHAVSAFNNAGFSLWPDSLMRWRDDVTVNLTFTTLIICGGLGFLVLHELLRLRRRQALSTHARLVLSMTGILLAIGTAATLALEWGNPATLGAIDSTGGRLVAAWFQSVTTRTAGFNTVDVGSMTHAGLFITMVLMFIGASPGGTGGGVKTTTFAITVAALWATVRGDDEPVLFRRRMAIDVVARAFFISLIAFLALNAGAAILLVLEQRPFLPTLFEATSAFSTVGLSTGEGGAPYSLAGHFTAVGKLLIVVMMFTGRVGPLTLAFALARRRRVRGKIRYPEGKVLIG